MTSWGLLSVKYQSRQIFLQPEHIEIYHHALIIYNIISTVNNFGSLYLAALRTVSSAIKISQQALGA
jgi:hypothetical protein